MSNENCPWCHLTPEDEEIARGILGQRETYSHEHLRAPDLIIAPDGKPYLYRWEIVRSRAIGNVYFHIQVADDPKRPLHDHPWDNFSVILAGGYDEIWNPDPWHSADDVRQTVRHLRKGDTVFRKASEAHRLELPLGVEYSMSLFSTGPKVREWGFWYPEGWQDYRNVTRTTGNISVHVKDGVDAQS